MTAKKIANSGFDDWTPTRLPQLNNQQFVITGGNSGLGLEAARQLIKRGANVCIACRDKSKAIEAVVGLSRLRDNARADYVIMDLANKASIRGAAREIRERYARIDGLVNNAGIMQTPPLKTADGFELQFGVNHLGHFLLTGLLFDRVEAARGRIVIVSSIAHLHGKIHFDDLMLIEGYTPTKAYCQSKLANLVFARELHKRLLQSSKLVSCIACHPGYTATALQSTGPDGFWKSLYKLSNATMAQSVSRGAMPILLAAAGLEALPGAYYGPQGFGGTRGKVSDAKVARDARDTSIGCKLWQESEGLLEFSFPRI